jgi:hypothetical protein
MKGEIKYDRQSGIGLSQRAKAFAIEKESIRMRGVKPVLSESLNTGHERCLPSPH